MTDTRQTEAPAAPPRDEPAHGAPVQSTTAAARADDKGKAMAVYVLYLASFVVGFTALIGLILAYLSKGDADPMIRSHYDNAIGVFWKGLLYGLACFVLTLTVIGALSWIGLAVWWGVRCVKGLLALNEGKPYPNPRAWGF